MPLIEFTRYHSRQYNTLNTHFVYNTLNTTRFVFSTLNNTHFRYNARINIHFEYHTLNYTLFV